MLLVTGSVGRLKGFSSSSLVRELEGMTLIEETIHRTYDELSTALRPLFIDASSILKISIPHHRSARTVQLDAALSSIDSSLSALSSFESQLQGLRDQLSSHKKLLSNALSPCLGLSEDILREIFSFVVPHYGATINHSSRAWRIGISLTHVCRLWRHTALGLNTLWSSLHITSPSQAPLVALFAQRSGITRLALTLDDQATRSSLEDDYYSPAYHWNSSPLILHPFVAKQLSAIHIKSVTEDNAIRISPQAEKELQLDSITVSLLRSSSARPLPQYAASTRQLNVRGPCITPHPLLRFPRLVELTATGCDMNSLVRLLHDTSPPLLKWLNIVESAGLTIDPTASFIAVLPSLEAIVIRRCPPSVFRHIGARLSVANLKSLRIESVRSYGPLGADLSNLMRTMLLFLDQLEHLALKSNEKTVWGMISYLQGPVPQHHPLPSLLRLCSLELDLEFNDQNASAHWHYYSETKGAFTRYLTTDEHGVRRCGDRFEELRLSPDIVGELEDWFRSIVPKFIIIPPPEG
ncbi:hypothetical protein DL93DRAFT_269253 [Clavulina sp. PMI_390]|nr:hypothetical protein DL93DRAFT_269253 [Clavulina sp. PMI_390]